MPLMKDSAAPIADITLSPPSRVSLSQFSLPKTDGCDHETLQRDEENATVDSEADNQDVSRFQLAVLTLALCLCTLIVSIDTVILATAIPKIASDFESLDDVGWYGSSYLLTQTALQPSFGKLYSHFNTKWTFLCGILIFEVGSLVCAIANSSRVLIVGRAIAGVGAAALFSGGMNIVSNAVPLRKRAPYIALLSSMGGVSNIIGPPLGGVLTNRLSWRWCFWINLPCGAAAFILVLAFLKEFVHPASGTSLKTRLAEMDLLGAVLLLAGITSFILAMEWAGKAYSWSDARVWGCILASGVILALFSILQWKLGDRATIPPRLMFKQRTIFSASLFSCFLAMGFYIHVYYLPIYFQTVKGSNPEKSGLDVVAYQASNTGTSLVVGLLVAVIGWYVPFVWFGAVAFVIGSGLLFTVDMDSHTATLVGYQIITGLGKGASVQIPYVAAQVVSNKKDMSSTNAIMIFFHSIGGTLSLAVGETIFLASLRRNLPIEAPLVNPAAIMKAGPTNLRNTVPPDQLKGVLKAYTTSLKNTFISPIVTGSIAFLCSLLLEWRSVKRMTVAHP